MMKRVRFNKSIIILVIGLITLFLVTQVKSLGGDELQDNEQLWDIFFGVVCIIGGTISALYNHNDDQTTKDNQNN